MAHGRFDMKTDDGFDQTIKIMSEDLGWSQSDVVRMAVKRLADEMGYHYEKAVPKRSARRRTPLPDEKAVQAARQDWQWALNNLNQIAKSSNSGAQVEALDLRRTVLSGMSRLNQLLTDTVEVHDHEGGRQTHQHQFGRRTCRPLDEARGADNARVEG